MAMNKIDRINREIEKTREKITEYQNKLKGLEAQKTEAENLQIVQLVRSMRLSPAELTSCLLYTSNRRQNDWRNGNGKDKRPHRKNAGFQLSA